MKFVRRLGFTYSIVVAALLGAAAAAPASTPVELRVVDSNGRTLAQQTQYTGSVEVETDPAANCLGQGSSSATVEVEGPTALGVLADGRDFNRKLNPLSVSNASQFGLGVCGIGRAIAPSTGFWYLKHEHAAAQVGGDQLQLSDGDQVLWFLDSNFNDEPPEELVLKGPARARPGTKFKVKVVAYGDTGGFVPAAGAEVTNALEPTDASGNASVRIPNEGPRTFQATRPGDIPSNELTICFEVDLDRCPAQPGETIYGSSRPDAVKGTAGSDRISTGTGADKIDLRNGGADRVQCGGGKDKVVGADDDDQVARNCDRPRRR